MDTKLATYSERISAHVSVAILIIIAGIGLVRIGRTNQKQAPPGTESGSGRLTAIDSACSDLVRTDDHPVYAEVRVETA